jgi:fermentation-respiration switch protein FrsA (DUF1100 family)
MQGVVSGEGWEGIPPDMRRRVDTPWYRSFLLFNPADVIKNVKQPMLIVQGELDTQVLAHHGSDLLALAQARKGRRLSELKTFPGVNHLMVNAATGEVDEYGSLKEKTLNAQLVAAIVEWLKKSLTTS